MALYRSKTCSLVVRFSVPSTVTAASLPSPASADNRQWSKCADRRQPKGQTPTPVVVIVTRLLRLTHGKAPLARRPGIICTTGGMGVHAKQIVGKLVLLSRVTIPPSSRKDLCQRAARQYSQLSNGARWSPTVPCTAASICPPPHQDPYQRRYFKTEAPRLLLTACSTVQLWHSISAHSIMPAVLLP
jgi:hypothetical protein